MAQRRINIRRAGLDETLSNLDIQVTVYTGWILFFLIWLSRRYDSTMVQHNQDANGPIRVHNLAPPRQPN